LVRQDGGRAANFTVRNRCNLPRRAHQSEVMRDLFDFDNTAFLERLERKGFFVARGSNANYCQTPLSRSSSFMIWSSV
jgi:hypothetical protein